MNRLIAVMTCPKRPEYLLDVLRQVDAQVPAHVPRAVYSDGNVGMIGGVIDYARFTRRGSWTLYQTAAEPSGTRAAFYRLLFCAFHLRKRWDELVLLEDDVQLARDWWRRLSAVSVPADVAFVSAYDYRETLGEVSGLHRRPCMPDRLGLCGQQCLIIPRRTVEHVISRTLTEWERLPDAPPEFGQSKNLNDLWFDYACSKGPTPHRAFLVPQLVQHRGVNSSLGTTRERHTWWFADDARPLPCRVCGQTPSTSVPLSTQNDDGVCESCVRFRPRTAPGGEYATTWTALPPVRS